jgi:Zn-dependent metalloprotease
MEIKSKKEDMMLPVGALVIIIPEQDAKAMIEVLSALKKKSKPDRYEEYILDKLIYAFEKPDEDLSWVDKQTKEAQQTVQVPKTEVKVSAHTDKKAVVELVKSRVDTKNEKSIEVFITESIDFAIKNFNIKTKPKNDSVEAFYDWLVSERIIAEDGSPIPR